MDMNDYANEVYVPTEVAYRSKGDIFVYTRSRGEYDIHKAEMSMMLHKQCNRYIYIIPEPECATNFE